MRTFIIRLQEDTGDSGRASASSARLRGVVDEVATGSRATFRNDHELVTALVAAMAADLPGSAGGSERLPGDLPSDRPGPRFEEQ